MKLLLQYKMCFQQKIPFETKKRFHSDFSVWDHVFNFILYSLGTILPEQKQLLRKFLFVHSRAGRDIVV
jgi:hypothetical protein